MSIRFPKSCRTRAQRSAHASRVATIGWERRRAQRPAPVWIGGITFDGPLAANAPMRLDLYEVDGEAKWTGITAGRLLPTRLSERSVLRLVRSVLRAPRCHAADYPRMASKMPYTPPWVPERAQGGVRPFAGICG